MALLQLRAAPARADDTVHIVNNATDGRYSTWGLANIAVVTGAALQIVIVAFAMNDTVEVPAIGSILRAAGARPAPS